MLIWHSPIRARQTYRAHYLLPSLQIVNLTHQRQHMTYKRILCFVTVLLGICLPDADSYAQTDPLFTKKPVFRSLSDRWELDSTTRKGTFIVTPYKPLYVTAGRWSTDPNEKPVSENPKYNYPPVSYTHLTLPTNREV